MPSKFIAAKNLINQSCFYFDSIGSSWQNKDKDVDAEKGCQRVI